MGTLVDSENTVKKARENKITLNNFKEEGYEITEEELEQAIRETQNEIRYIKGEKRHQDALFTRILTEKLGLDLTEKEIIRIESKFNKFLFENMELIEGTREILDYLNEEGIEVVLISNGRTKEVEDRLNKFDLKEYFSETLTSEEIGKRKHRLEPFKRVLETREVETDQILMVGNRKDEDAHAKRLGMKAVLFKPQEKLRREEDTIEPDYEIESLKEIKEIIQRENSGEKDQYQQS